MSQWQRMDNILNYLSLGKSILRVLLGSLIGDNIVSSKMLWFLWNKACHPVAQCSQTQCLDAYRRSRIVSYLELLIQFGTLLLLYFQARTSLVRKKIEAFCLPVLIVLYDGNNWIQVKRQRVLSLTSKSAELVCIIVFRSSFMLIKKYFWRTSL